MKIRGGWWALAAMVAVSIALLLAGYVAAYYATVGQMWVLTMPSDFGTPEGVPEPAPKYRPILGFEPNAFFAPMHAIDKRLRPKVWKPPPPIPVSVLALPEDEF